MFKLVQEVFISLDGIATNGGLDSLIHLVEFGSNRGAHWLLKLRKGQIFDVLSKKGCNVLIISIFEIEGSHFDIGKFVVDY